MLFFFFVRSACAQSIENEGLSFHSAELDCNVKYSIVLPEGYYDSEERYPVLYMLHGIGGDYSSWLEYGNVSGVMDRLSAEEGLSQFVIVMPDGYLSYYNDAFDGSFPYESFFIKEFVPFIDGKYRTLPQKRFRAVAGFSMGGFGALSLVLRNRDMFGSAAALSPSIRTDGQYCSQMPQKDWDDQWGGIFGGKGENGTGRLTEYYKERSPYHIINGLRKEDLKDTWIFLDIGDREKTLCEPNEQLHELLLKRGMPHRWGVRGGGHDFQCWNAALPEVFDFLERRFAVHKKVGSIPVNCENRLIVNKDGIYLPYKSDRTCRKYPVVYVYGKLTADEERIMAAVADSLQKEGEIRPVAVCFMGEAPDINLAVKKTEIKYPQIRGSQRMRCLVLAGGNADVLVESLRSENLFSGIVMYDAVTLKYGAEDFIKVQGHYARYPRIWLEDSPGFAGYGFESDLHVLMVEKSLEHTFRSRASCIGNPLLEYWKEWLHFFDERIHI